MKKTATIAKKKPVDVASSASRPSAFGFHLAVPILVCIVAVSVYWFVMRSPDASAGTVEKKAPLVPDHDRFALRHYNIIGKVPVKHWEPQKPFARDVIEANVPVVLKNTFVSQWPALKRWNPQTLTQRTGEKMYDFKVLKDDNIFIYSQPKPLDSLPELNFREPFNISYYTVKQFWGLSNLLQNFTNTRDEAVRRGKSWLYFAGCLKRSKDELQEFPSLLQEVPNLLGFVANEKFYASHLWLGSRGVTAQTHFDEAPNFATQVYGHKRWILSPPSEAPKIYGYPWLHPFRSQSQVDFASPEIKSIDYRARKHGEVRPTSAADYPLFGNITAYEALMEPGDVLYIPPMWYHRVVTEDASIMINSWTDPPQGDPHGKLTELPLPLEEEWPLEQKAVGLVRFFKAIAAHLPELQFLGSSAGTEWAFELLKQQYTSLWKNNLMPMSEGGSTRILCSVPAESDAVIIEKLESKTEVIATAAGFIQEHKDAYAGRVLFAAYIEKAVDVILGVEYAHSFVTDCL